MSIRTTASLPHENLSDEPLPMNDRLRVSLTMIVKNEEANLPACLKSIADLVGEIIVVDTGSTDRTREIAQEYGARVIDFSWIDSFAAARNESLQHATGEWIFWMDADDRLDAANRFKLRALFAQLPSDNVGFVMNCLCLPDDTGAATVVNHLRLFRNHPQHRWTYRVHEQMLPALRRQDGRVCRSDVVIHHVGYQDAQVRQRKIERDQRLLIMEFLEQPNDPFTLFNLASVYLEQDRLGEALALFQRSLQHSAADDTIVPKLYAQIIQCHRRLGQADRALQVCADAHQHCAEDLEVLYQEALARRTLNDRAGAITMLERILTHRDYQPFTGIDAGLRGYKTRHNLACFLREEGRLDEAQRHWQQALQEQPSFLPALVGSAEIYLARHDWPAFDAIVLRLRQSPNGLQDAHTLQARKHLSLQEFAQARAMIAQAIALNEKSLWPRVVLTHVLLQEGKDWSAAEQALRQVLALDPHHAESRRNLEILLHRSNSYLVHHSPS